MCLITGLSILGLLGWGIYTAAKAAWESQGTLARKSLSLCSGVLRANASASCTTKARFLPIGRTWRAELPAARLSKTTETDECDPYVSAEAKLR